MSIQPVQQICPQSKWSIKCPYAMEPEMIVVHNTANDASAANEITYMNNNNNQVSFHFAIDDKEVRQGIPLNRNAWHAGDGGNGRGNRKGISIEICYSLSGGDRFIKAEQLAAKFIAQLLIERNWGLDKVTKHQDYSGKYCPHRTLDMGWTRFLNMVQAEVNIYKTPKFVWATLDNAPSTYVSQINTKLVNLATKETVRNYGYDVTFDFVEKTTADGLVYYRTQYSKEHDLDYGIPASDVELFVPAEKKISWKALKPARKMVALRDCNLINLKTGAIQKTFAMGEVIDNLVQETVVNDTTYYRTQYSKDKNLDYGIDSYQLGEYTDPKDDEKVVLDYKDNVLDLISDPPKMDEATANWFVSLFTALANFIKNLFVKED